MCASEAATRDVHPGDSMGEVVVLAEQPGGASHVWLRRQLLDMAPLVRTVITEAGGSREISNSFPSFELVKLDGSSGLNRRLRRLLIQGQIAYALEQPGVRAALVHYLTFATKYTRAWGWTRTPVFVHCHGYDVTWDLRSWQTGNPVHEAEYVDAVLALPANVEFIANSHWTRGKLAAIGVPTSRVHVKYFGIEVPDTPPDRVEHPDVRILYLGRLVDFKGPDQVIRAFSLACDRGLNGRLSMAGDGPMLAKCLELKAGSAHGDRIEFLGEVTESEGKRLRAETDLFTAHNCRGPSGQEEAFGVTNLEAMADGLPIVGTRSGAVPEVVVDGECGILVEPGSVVAHAEAFLTLGRSAVRRRELGRGGWERARRMFTKEREMTRMKEILLRTATRGAS